MLRLVLAVALAAAILAVVTPALEDARATRTERLTARELDRIQSAAETLATEESSGARRVLTISLPGESPSSAPLAFVSVGGVPDRTAPNRTGADRTGAGGASGIGDGPGRDLLADTPDRDVFAYRIAGGSTGIRRVGVDLRVVRGDETVASDSRALVLLGGETYRLTLRLIRTRGRLTVVVSVGDSSAASGRGKPPPPNSERHRVR